MDYVFYVADIETTGLDSHIHDVIELSLYRLGAEEEVAQKTWCFKPLNPTAIDPGSLRINGHKLEDLLHQTKEGRERYLDPNQALVEVENWLAEDNVPNTQRVAIGQNVYFDLVFLEQFWNKCGSKDTFPFGRRIIDTMVWAFMLDYADNNFAEGYSLANLTKKYGVKNDRAHSAASDVRATKEVFEKQVAELRKRINVK